MMKPVSFKRDNAIFSALRCVIIGSFFGGLLCALLLAAFSFGFVKMQHIAQITIDPIIIFISAISSFFAGYIAVRISHKNGLIFGMFAGMLLCLLLFLVGFIFTQESITITTLTRLAVMAISGAIGGFVAVSRKR